MAKLVWVVALWGRMVVMAAEKSDCSLLLIGPGGASAYTITDTELNVNFAAESLERTGPCCFAVYSHPTRAKGVEILVNSGGQIPSLLPKVGSAFVVSCSENSGTIIMNCLLGLSIIIIGLIVIFALFSTFGGKCRDQVVRRRGGLRGHQNLQEEKEE